MVASDDLYVFYDTETTGLDINFSQIIQIGCVLTDSNFNILEELNLSSKVLPWIVPSPDASGEGTIHGRTFELKLSSSSMLKLLSVNTHPI